MSAVPTHLQRWFDSSWPSVRCRDWRNFATRLRSTPHKGRRARSSFGRQVLLKQHRTRQVSSFSETPLLREQGVGSSNLPAPTNLFSSLENLLEHRMAVWVAFSRPRLNAMSTLQRLRTFAASPFESHHRFGGTSAAPQLADMPAGRAASSSLGWLGTGSAGQPPTADGRSESDRRFGQSQT